MAITFPLVSPSSYGIATAAWQARENTARARNPWTLNLITQVFDGRMWEGKLTIVPQNEANGRALTAWLAALRRPGANAGQFLFEGPARPVPLGSAASTPGSPVVNGAGQTGESLNVSGLPTSATGYLLAGDWIQIGSGASSRLLMCLEDVSSDGSGNATMTLWPGIRTAPGNGSAVVVSGAQGVFISPGGASVWNVRPPRIYDGITIDVAEVVP